MGAAQSETVLGHKLGSGRGGLDGKGHLDTAERLRYEADRLEAMAGHIACEGVQL
jgi:hypothetical protein